VHIRLYRQVEAVGVPCQPEGQGFTATAFVLVFVGHLIVCFAVVVVAEQGDVVVGRFRILPICSRRFLTSGTSSDSIK